MFGLLRAVWDEPRPSPVPRRVWRDWALLFGLVPLVVVEGLLTSDRPWRLVTVIITAALVPTLWWRRTQPLLMVAIVFGVCGLAPFLTGQELDLNSFAFVLFLPYALVRWGSGRDIVLGGLIMLAKLASGALLGHMSLGEALLGLLVIMTTGALGAALRFRASARLRELEQVKLLERERLARDLHDTVAHHVSAMAIRAQAGLAMAADPQRLVEALQVIEAEATQALAEMRSMVRVLRQHERAALAPTPRVADLARLAGRFRAGPSVEVEVVGATEELAPAVSSAIYRLAQESVTNARRHARHATRVEVRVTVDDTSVHLRVTDDGETSPVRSLAAGGFGLVGMAERAGLLGGTCEAGPGPERGWTVTAILPLAPVAP